jgi:hypothetical protein
MRDFSVWRVKTKAGSTFPPALQAQVLPCALGPLFFMASFDKSGMNAVVSAPPPNEYPR